MKPFHFSLEKVLKIRQVQTLKAEQALAATHLTVGRSRAVLEQSVNLRTAAAAELMQVQSRRVPVSTWTLASSKHEAMGRAEIEAIRDWEAALADVHKQRLELQQARIREKALEILREQQHERARHEVDMAEQALNDELAQNMRRLRKGDAML